MKTNEEKLKQLLQISVENGWTPTFICKEIIADNCIEYEVANNIVKIELLPYTEAQYTLKGFVSLNDLVTNWEEGEVSFIEALCKEDNSLSFYRNQELQWKIVRKLWDTFEDGEPRPTSERLQWLFDTFSHLLN